MLPEVVFLAEFIDAVLRDHHLFVPDLIGFVIAFIYGRIQTLGIQADDLGQELPCPRNGLILEIIAEREVAQHLEESAVPRGLADVLQVACTDALLAGGHALPGGDFLACEIRLEGRHTGVDDQKALVVMRDQ